MSAGGKEGAGVTAAAKRELGCLLRQGRAGVSAAARRELGCLLRRGGR